MSKLALKLIEKEKQEKKCSLDLGNCGLTCIPVEVFELTWLEELSLGEYIWIPEKGSYRSSQNNQSPNRIKNIHSPELFSSLGNLHTLNLNKNEITELSFLKYLNKLKHLNLSENKISDIYFLNELTNICELDLSSNDIHGIFYLKNLKKLVALSLKQNPIFNFIMLEELENLKILDLSENQIFDYSFLHAIKKLRSLKLTHNKIFDTSFLNRLSDLQFLDLSYNEIGDFRFIKKTKKMQSLNLSNNKLSGICDLSILTDLRSINLSNNDISKVQLNENLNYIPNMDLSHNSISDISSLYFLFKKGACITMSEEPDKEFKGISICDNPLTNPPISIVEKGLAEVLNWYEQIFEGESPLFECKLMILGQGEAGKTTFANLQIDPDYRVEPGKLSSTLGIIVHKGKSYNHKTISDQKIIANLWDFGGQDIQKMLHQFFITENCLYVLVSDKRAENTNFDYWFQIITLLGPESNVVVLENPKDLNSSTDDFPKLKYTELFTQINIDSIEVDLSKTRSRDKIKWKLLNEMLEYNLSELEIVNRKVPQKWSLIRDELKKFRTNKYITKDHFFKLCQQEYIGVSPKRAELCLYYLRELGDLVYFDDHNLCSYIFLDHNWLTQGMYYILSDKRIKKANGRFSKNEAFEHWDKYGYSNEEKSILLQLLLKNNFDICYELPDDKNIFITPLLLSNDKPSTWENTINLHFRYQYSFLPHGIFSRLIVRLHKKIEKEIRWKTGVRLIDKHKGHKIRAEVEQFTDPEGNQKVIDIKINGRMEGNKELLAFIRSELDKLHDGFKAISFKELVGCNCEACLDRKRKGLKPTFYDYNKLLLKLKNRRLYDECEYSGFQPIKIGQILNDIIIKEMAPVDIQKELVSTNDEKGIEKERTTNIHNVINISDIGKSSSFIDSRTIKLSFEASKFMDEIDSLREDIIDERKLLSKKGIDADELDVTIKDIEKAEKALSEIDTALQINKEPQNKSKNRLQRFINDLIDEDSNLNKTLKTLRRGRDYSIGLAEGYNKIAQNTGMPSVPPAILEIIKKL